MSGHSKWSTIKRAKGITDIKRGLTFTKVANAITIATRLGGSGDPDANPRLRMVMDEARGVNMPKDNILRAIDKGLGKSGEQFLEEVLYEGFGPFGTAFLVEAVTDNKMRTLQVVKNIFDKAGGNLAGTGAVLYMFERVGEIKVKSRKEEGKNEEEEILELIDLGAKYIQDYLVYTEAAKLAEMSNKITQAGYGVESQRLIYKPTVLIDIESEESAQKILDLISKLEEQDDVQKVYTNYELQ